MQETPEPAPALPSSGTAELTHKLNNLLTVVLAHAEASLTSADPEEMKQALGIIVKASNSMAATVRAFSKTAASANSIASAMQRVEGQ